MSKQLDEFSRIVARLENDWDGLPDKPGETPETTARALWLCAAGTPRSVCETGQDRDLPGLDAEGEERLEQLVRSRIRGTPLAYLTRRQSFMGLELLAGPQAMVPRVETELLGRKAAACLHSLVQERGEVRVLDLCTGSGNLAVALAVHEPQATVVGSDLTAASVDLAGENARLHAVSDRVSFIQGDLFAPFDAPEFYGAFDLVVCNPPYISSHKVRALPPEIAGHEPLEAFDGGPLGLSIILRLVQEAPSFMRPGAWLCFEVGAGQGQHIRRRVQRSPAYSEIETVSDDIGRIRVVAVRTATTAESGGESETH